MASIPYPGDSYITPSGSASFWASRLPTLSFLWKVFCIILHDARLAQAGKYRAEEWAEGSRNTLLSLEQCGVSVAVQGMDNVDKVDGPCVFVANHMSTLETFVLPVLVQPRKPVTFVVKQSLLRLPWFGVVLASRDPVVVDRVSPRKDLVTVLEEGEKRLKSGTSIIVFPQSTRSSQFDAAQFNSIGIKVARRAGVPVIPIALRTDAWGMGALFKDFGAINPALPVHFAFGEPFFVQGSGKEEHSRVCSFITERLSSWSQPIVDFCAVLALCFFVSGNGL